MKLYEYIIRRLILMVFVLFAVSVIVFYLTRGPLPPGSVLAPYISPRMNDIEKLQLAQSLGVATPSCASFSDFTSRAPGCIVPLWSQYFSWLKQVFSGNWGYSQIPGIGVGLTTWQLFIDRFPFTAELAIAGALLTVIVAIPLGIVSATHNNKAPDHASRIVALTGYSMPIFWLGFLLQIAFVIYITVPRGPYQVGLLQSNGVLSTNCGMCIANPGNAPPPITGMPVIDSLLAGNLAYFWDSFVALILPTITLSFATLGALTRVVRSSMMECLRQDYILLARSKGIKERSVVYKHALKNAMLPAITITGLIFAALLGGVVIVEYIFSWPGVGAAALQASLYLDVNFLELYTLVTALIIVVSNLGVDVLYAFIDPRIRY